jgi:hypothetical protein
MRRREMKLSRRLGLAARRRRNASIRRRERRERERGGAFRKRAAQRSTRDGLLHHARGVSILSLLVSAAPIAALVLSSHTRTRKFADAPRKSAANRSSARLSRGNWQIFPTSQPLFFFEPGHFQCHFQCSRFPAALCFEVEATSAQRNSVLVAYFSGESRPCNWRLG